MRVPKDGERVGMGLSQYYILRMRSIPEKLERSLAAAERVLRLRLKMTHRWEAGYAQARGSSRVMQNCDEGIVGEPGNAPKREAVPNETASKSIAISELFRGRRRGLSALLCFLTALLFLAPFVGLLAGVRGLAGIGRCLAAGAAGGLPERQAASDQQREHERS